MQNMEETISRRKQLKPAKLSTVENSSATIVGNGASSSRLVKCETEEEMDVVVTVDVGAAESVPLASVKDELRAKAEQSIDGGTVFGPFPVRQDIGEKDDFDSIVHIPDKGGKLHMFLVENKRDKEFLQKIRFTKKDDIANSVLTLNGMQNMDWTENKLQMVTRKIVSSREDVLAIFYPNTRPNRTPPKLENNNLPFIFKNHACNMCGTRFSNIQTLNAHKTSYCQKRKLEEQESNEENGPIRKQACTDLDEYRKECNAVDTCAIAETSRAMQNTLLLPVAYTNAPGVTILGHPQTIIPVAIPKTMTLEPTPLIIQADWAKGIQIDFMKGVPIDGSSSFSIPLAFTDSLKSAAPPVTAIPAQPAEKHKEQSGGKIGKSGHKIVVVESKTVKEGGKPLDLTIKTPPKENACCSTSQTAIAVSPVPSETTSDDAATKPARQSPDSTDKTEEVIPTIDRRIFVCPACGIKFSSLHTLKGHQQYYCKANVKEDDENEDVEVCKDPVVNSSNGRLSLHPNSPAAVIASSSSSLASPAAALATTSRDIVCGHCDYVAANHSQLTQHNRSQHAQVQGYICEMCGYKGYSMRGMKSHMKVHAETQNSRGNLSAKIADDLVKLHVKPLPGTDNPFSTIRRTSHKDQLEEETLKQLMTLGGLTAQALMSSTVNLPIAIGHAPALLCRGCQKSYPDYISYTIHKCTKSSDATSSNGHQELKMKDKGDEYDSSTEDCRNDSETSESDGQEKHTCGHCNYKSPYKGNVKRHETLIHKTCSEST